MHEISIIFTLKINYFYRGFSIKCLAGFLTSKRGNFYKKTLLKLFANFVLKHYQFLIKHVFKKSLVTDYFVWFETICLRQTYMV